MLCTGRYISPAGDILIAADNEGLTGLWFMGQKHFPVGLTGGTGENPAITAAKNWLDCYFGGKVPENTPPLHLTGTAFRLEVWDILLTIPYGETVTYGEIARRLAKRRGTDNMSPRAVGGAVGHNPVSVIVPCHRVIGADGSLTGYAGGKDMKAFLLGLEAGNIQKNAVAVKI